MTFRRGPGDIVSGEKVREGQDVVIETQLVGPEVNIDLANNPLHPPDTSFRVAPGVEESIRRKDVRRSRMSRTLMDTERKRNNTNLQTGVSIKKSIKQDMKVVEEEFMDKQSRIQLLEACFKNKLVGPQNPFYNQKFLNYLL